MTSGGANIRIIFAGGGTGGHLYPALAMHQALRKSAEVEALFIGTRGGMEATLLREAGVNAAYLSGYGLRGASPLRKIAAAAVTAVSIVRAAGIIRQFRPDVVVGTGGYASAAVVMAAFLMRVPRVLQEQNSVPGLVNRRLARFAQLVLLSYPRSSDWLPASVPVMTVGNPLRPLTTLSPADARRQLDLDPDRLTLLVIGGSRGAKSLNLAMSKVIGQVLGADDREVQFIISTGAQTYDETVSSLSSGDSRIKVVPYLDDVGVAYSAADVAVARAGASTVFELAHYGIPTIFVPYPRAADNHQRLNVEPLLACKAALLCEDSELDSGKLYDEVEQLLASPSQREEMSKLMRNWVMPGAADHAAAEILAIAKKKECELSITTGTRVGVC